MAEHLTQDLVELLGEENFIRLVEHYGGQSCYIADRAEKSFMTSVLGEDIMKVLAYYYGGTPLKVPIGRAYLARHYRLKGMNNREIARKLLVTESTVYRLFKRHPVRKSAARTLEATKRHWGMGKIPKHRRTSRDPRQIDMFG